MTTATVSAHGKHRVPANEADRALVIQNPAAHALGWFSIALGAAEVFAPHAVARFVGIRSNPKLVRLLGAREIASGIGILASRRPTPWLWARVAGDILDLAVLGSAPLRPERGAGRKLAAATAAVAGVALLDIVVGARYHGQGKSKPASPRNVQDQLVHFLSDMYSVEQQALAQLITAPDIAGHPLLAEDFRKHYVETERQAEMVRERLEALGGSPSRIKDAVMKLGGKGFLLFARAMPETPGRLVVHAYSYEAMEWAGYEMLIRFADWAGDRETFEAAETIRDQERAMMKRLEDGFDAAEQASHADVPQDQLREHLVKHLAEVHAFETQNIQLLSKSARIAGNATLAAIYRDFLEGIQKHAKQVERRLESLNSGTSTIRDAALALGGLNWGFFFQAQSDTAAKLAAFVYAVLHLEIGGYELLKRTAQRIHDRDTLQLCETILDEKRSMAGRLVAAFDAAVDATCHAA